MWMKPPVRLDLCGVAGSVDVRAAKVASVSMPSLGTDGSDDDDLCSVTLQSAQGDDVVKARLLVGAAVVAVPLVMTTLIIFMLSLMLAMLVVMMLSAAGGCRWCQLSRAAASGHRRRGVGLQQLRCRCDCAHVGAA